MIYFSLNKEKSIEYVQNDSFRSLLLSKVESGWNQIALRIDDFTVLSENIPIHKVIGSSELSLQQWANYHSITCKYPRTFAGFPPLPQLDELDVDFAFVTSTNPNNDLTPLSGLKQLHIRNLNTSDITPLKDIPDLSLSTCQSITDFSMLSTQRKLTIWNCSGLTNVASFHRIRKLELVSCFMLQDVRPLYGVYDLKLTTCFGLKDISGLGGHHRFSLGNFNIDKGFEILINIPHVTLRYTNIEDLNVLKYAKSVNLFGCPDVVDVGAFKNAKAVRIVTASPTQLRGLQELGEVPELLLTIQSDSEREVDDNILSYLNNPRLRLRLSKLPPIINSFSAFSSRIKHLTIGISSKFSDFIHGGQGVLLNHLSSLTIEMIPTLKKVNGLGDIPTLKFRNCEGLKQLKGLGRNRCVEVDSCYNLKDVSSLKTVLIVSIKYCPKITNFQCLKNVPRLKVITQENSGPDERYLQIEID